MVAAASENARLISASCLIVSHSSAVPRPGQAGSPTKRTAAGESFDEGLDRRQYPAGVAAQLSHVGEGGRRSARDGGHRLPAAADHLAGAGSPRSSSSRRSRACRSPGTATRTGSAAMAPPGRSPPQPRRTRRRYGKRARYAAAPYRYCRPPASAAPHPGHLMLDVALLTISRYTLRAPAARVLVVARIMCRSPQPARR